MSKDKKHQVTPAHKHGSVLVIGGGIAGLSFALRAARHGTVVVFTKPLAEARVALSIDNNCPPLGQAESSKATS